MQKPLPFLNKKRLLAYPYLVFIPLWLITLVNVAFAKNWYGLFGGFIGYDFLSFYSGGKLFWTDTANLYNEGVLAKLQSRLVGIPTTGLNFFPYPPFNGMLFGLFSFMPYPIALTVWTALSVTCLVISVWLIYRYIIPQKIIDDGVSFPYLLALVLSFYPIIFGLQNGQDHFIFLLLFTLITIFTIRKQVYLAGICAAFLLIKPQLLLGWLILWFLLKYYKAIMAFALAGTALIMSPILFKGISPYVDYLRYIPVVSRIYQSVNGWEITPVAIIDRILLYVFGKTSPMAISIIVLAIFIIGMVSIIRKSPSPPYYIPIIISLLIPLFSFHNLLYDLVLVIPLFAVWSRCSSSRLLLISVIVIYLSALILPIISDTITFPLMGVLPVFLLIAIGIDLGFFPVLHKTKTATQDGI